MQEQGNLIDYFKNIDVLSSLSSQDLQRIEKHLYFRKYKKGQMLFLQGDPRERIYVIIQGYVRLEKTNANGTTQFDAFLKPLTFFPNTGLFSEDYYSFSVETITSVEVLYIPTFYFEELIRKNKRLLIQLVKNLSKQQESLELRVRSMTNGQASNRIVQVIGYLARELGIPNENDILIPCPITVTDIARFTGTSRETVSTVLNHLKKSGKLKHIHRQLVILDIAYFNQ